MSSTRRPGYKGREGSIDSPGELESLLKKGDNNRIKKGKEESRMLK